MHKRIALLTFIALTTITAAAAADDFADEADLQFNLGADAYEKGDFRNALEHFLASNRLVPNKNVTFNIARSYEQLKQGPEAYRYYLQALEAETRPDARKRIEDGMARVAATVALLRVESDPPGTLFLDRIDLGPRGLTPRVIALAPGKHKVIVTLNGHQAASKDDVELRLGAETKVSLRLTPILGVLRVDGEPGTSVRLDKEDAPVSCVTPCEISSPPGKHTLILAKPGYETQEMAVEVQPRGNQAVRARLIRQTGVVVINTDVRDALVTIDGQPSGFTPAVLNVPVGHHKLRVNAAGFRAIEQEIDVDKIQNLKLDLELGGQQEVSAASRVTETVEEAPASVSIITGQELRAMGYPTIAEALRGVRGMYLSNDTSYDSLGVRGFSRPGDYGNRVLVLVDGHPANDNYVFSSYIGFDGRVDLDDVERIEIIRGPGSVLYGTSAFFGVINLITRGREDKTHGEAGVSGSMNGVGRARATAYVRINEDSGVWSSVSGAHGTGRDYFFPSLAGTQDPRHPGTPTAVYDGNSRGADGFDAATVSGRAWYKSLTLQWFLTSRKKSLPSGEYGTILGDPSTRYSDTRGFLEARFEPQLSKTVQLFSRAHVDMYNFDSLLAYPSLTQDPASTGNERDTYRGRWGGIEQRVLYTPSSALRLTLGASFIQHFQTSQRGETDAGPQVYDDKGGAGRDDPFSVAAAYANADYAPLKFLKVSAGARFDYYSSLDKFNALDAFNPRLAIIVKPYSAGTIKLLFGKAFRAPSVYELFYTATTQIRSNGLAPEQVYSAELEYSHRFSSVVVGSVATFVNQVGNLIELNDVNTQGGVKHAVPELQCQRAHRWR
jgi:outer membrane receptor protein involved in Fe transport